MKLITHISKITLAAICLVILSMGTVFAQQGDLAKTIEQARQSGIEQAEIEAIRQRAESRGISDRHLVEILGMATELSNNKLPYDLVIQKAMEGMSKGVPGSRIVSVLDRIGSHAGETATVVDTWLQDQNVGQMVNGNASGMSQEEFRSELIKSGSRARMQNVPGETIEAVLSEIRSPEILSKTTPSNIIAAVGILPDLSSSVGQPDRASAFVVRALKGGFGAGELQKLPAALNVAKMRSQLPAAAVIEGVADQLRNGIPASQILKNLFDGKIGAGPPGKIPPGLDNRGKKGGGGNSI